MPSKKDIAILIIAFLAGGCIFGALVWKFKPSQPQTKEDDKFIVIRSQIDSIKSLVKTNNTKIDTLFIHEKQDDRSRINNFKILANELKQIPHLTNPTRKKYLDSLAASEGL